MSGDYLNFFNTDMKTHGYDHKLEYKTCPSTLKSGSLKYYKLDGLSIFRKI